METRSIKSYLEFIVQKRTVRKLGAFKAQTDNAVSHDGL